ncbi:2Fe-2S iron-sulfur cluster-binding protein [Marinifilum caeruleilacunae]|uniref:2Fe-2S iron-sulfur cluster binding domain-containing protein n=1 Tax=Marinifilum caeruleilacunae TaxID=2499076 RepID=A0ABX1WXW1_9BACT|nr:2Fe-2S iron-sulfur cluster-binding protein [Marinifilum caeruleilacunae]NOU60959.1 2Fe-2S iron-sulfur cluster binding domain-containing protein [Marinifilum caeruleilacunae]
MPTITIDKQTLEVAEGTSILNAARSAGIEIPSMCYLDGCSNHPTCMVCMVKNNANQQMIPSCATKVVDGMDLASDDAEVKEARKEAIELLMSDHVGDCEAPCRVACPAYMDIPKMNRFIANNQFDKALQIVKEEIALPGILGYVCSAPCEKVCRRKDVDQAVSICLLKRFSDEESNEYLPEKKESNGKKVAVIGSGPAGLSAAYHLLLNGYSCEVFEKEEQAGGSLLPAIEKGELPEDILKREIEILKKLGLVLNVKQEITLEKSASLQKDFDALILANGAEGEVFDLEKGKSGLQVKSGTYATSNSKVFACGSIIRVQKMAVKAVAMGKEAAWSVDSYLSKGEAKTTERLFNSRFGTLRKEELAEYLKESVEGDRVEAKSPKGYSKEEAIAEAKRCMHCDCRKLDNCRLRDCAEEYKIDRRRFALGERNSVVKYMKHDSVIYEPEKCIKCGLCIEIAERHGEKTGLTNIGRGFTVKVAVPFNQELNEALKLAGRECAEACPTGALSMNN